LDRIHVCSACVAPCDDPEGQLVLTLTRRSSLSRLGWVIFKSSRLGCVFFKSLETWMSHFQSLETWMRLFQVSRDLDASFSRSGIPIRETARHSEARRQPARHSRRVASMFLCWQIRHLLSKKARSPVPIVIHVKVGSEKSQTCCLVLRAVVPRTVASPRASAAARTSWCGVESDNGCRLRIFCVSIGPVQTVRHTHKITQTNMPGSRCPSVYGILIYICVQLSAYVRGGAPSDQNFCILFIYLITQKKWGHSRQA
jgi:hypothetical protein